MAARSPIWRRCGKRSLKKPFHQASQPAGAKNTAFIPLAWRLISTGTSGQALKKCAHPLGLALRRKVDDFKRHQNVIRERRQEVVGVVGHQAFARRMMQVEIARQLAKRPLLTALEPAPLKGGLRAFYALALLAGDKAIAPKELPVGAPPRKAVVSRSRLAGSAASCIASRAACRRATLRFAMRSN